MDRNYTIVIETFPFTDNPYEFTAAAGTNPMAGNGRVFCRTFSQLGSYGGQAFRRYDCFPCIIAYTIRKAV